MVKLAAVDRANQTPKWIEAGSTNDWSASFVAPGIVTYDNGHLAVGDVTPGYSAFPLAVTIDRIPDYHNRMALIWFYTSGPDSNAVICPEGVYLWDGTWVGGGVVPFDLFVPFSPAVNIVSSGRYRFELTNPSGNTLRVSVVDDINPSVIGVAEVTFSAAFAFENVFLGRRSGSNYVTLGSTFQVPDQTRIVSLANF